LSKSIGKLVLFRKEDLTDKDTNIGDTWKDSENRAYLNWGTQAAKKEILRNQTYNYEIVDGALTNDGLMYKWLGEIKSITPVTKQNKNVVIFQQNVETKKWINYINLSPEFKANPKGINSSEYNFVNHNLALGRPLMSNANKHNKESGLDTSAYGFDDQIIIDPVYNFYLKRYEEYFRYLESSNYLPEKVIPNFYHTMLFRPHLEEPPWSSDWESNGIFGLHLHVNTKDVSSFLKSITETIKNPKYGNTKFANEYKSERRFPFQGDGSVLQERNSFVVLTSDFFKEFNSLIKTQENVYPYYNKISIPTIKEGTAFREFFKKYGCYEDLQFSIASSLKLLQHLRQHAGPQAVKDKVESVKKKYDVYKLSAKEVDQPHVIYGTTIDKFTGEKIHNAPIKVVSNKVLKSEWSIDKDTDIYEFNFMETYEKNGTRYTWLPGLKFHDWTGKSWDNSNPFGKISYMNLKGHLHIPRAAKILNDMDIKDPTMEAQLYLTTYNETAPLMFHGPPSIKNPSPLALALKSNTEDLFEKLIDVMQLTAKSVLNNKQNYSEILYFEIAKYDHEPKEDSVPFQTFILPNDQELEVVDYIDSQIKYEKKYFYQIYAHTISVGNNMKRNQLNAKGKAPMWKYDNFPDVKILRVPYYNTGSDAVGTINIDSPPMPPNIFFFPYKNVSDKIGFWFNVQMGEAKMKPVTSLLTQKQWVQMMNYSTKTGDFNQLWKSLLYKTDDYGGQFEIYRITKRPEKYADFKNAKIATVDVIGAKTLIDNIKPNQDYYYIFRSIDVHGMPSNPTPVYHMKMITHNDVPEADSVHIGTSGDQPVLFNEIIYLNDNYEEKIDNKSFKKYLLIEPSLRQTFLNFDTFDENWTSEDVLNLSEQLEFGNSEDKLFGKKFKIRVTSKQTGRKLDVNVNFKSPDIYKKEEET
jgi:hypothetical protein